MTATLPAIPRCPTCGAAPEIAAGVVATVTFDAEGTATITVDLSEMDDDARDGDWAWSCACDDGDAEAFTEASHDLAAVLADVIEHVTPTVEYLPGSAARDLAAEEAAWEARTESSNR